MTTEGQEYGARDDVLRRVVAAVVDRVPLTVWRRLAGLLAGALLALMVIPSEARVTTRNDFQSFMAAATGTGSFAMGFASNGTPLATTGGAGSTGQGNMNFGFASGGKPYAQGDIKVPVPGGGAGNATARVPLTKYGGAIFRAGAKLFWPLAAASALYDLAQELGYTRGVGPDGTMQVGRMVGQYEYSIIDSASAIDTGWLTDWQGVCDAFIAIKQTQEPQYAPVLLASTENQCNWRRNTNQTLATAINKRAGTPHFSPTTESEFASTVDGAAGFPTGSKIAEAIAEAARQGEFPSVSDTSPFIGAKATAGQSASAGDGSPTATCTDQTVPGGSTTVTNPDGSKTITQTNWLQKCNGSVVAVTEQTVTSSVNAQGQTSTLSTLTKDTAAAAEADKKCPPGDTSAACQRLDVPEGDPIPKRTVNVTYSPVDLALGNGACPASPQWSDRLGSHTVDLSPFCAAITNYVKPVVLLGALLAAYFIVAGGVMRPN